MKSPGFKQPIAVHQHWHIDISYVNVLGTIFFLITVLDGKSRYVVAHDLRAQPITAPSLPVRILANT